MKKYLFLAIIVPAILMINDSYSQTRGLMFGDILWQKQIPDNPGTTVQNKMITSLKQIPDVNGDGVNDVIATTGNYYTFCYSGLNGNVLWQYDTYFGSFNTGSVDWEDAVDMADLNGDGITDVVIGCGGGNEMVYALNGINGNVLWSYGNTATTNDGDIVSVNIKYDFNGDGVKDVLVSASGASGGTGGRHAAICLNGITGLEIFNSTQSNLFTTDIIATESGGAIGVNSNGSPYAVHGLNTTGSIVWNYVAPGNVWTLKEIPDVNNNGSKDILGMGGFAGAIFAINGNSGAQIWAQSLGSSNNGKIQLLDDANGNGFIDFTLSAPQVAYRIDSKTGTILWSNPLGSSYLRGVDDIKDVNGDGIDDIVIATQTPARLLVLNGMTGAILFDYLFGSTITQRGDRAAVLKDIDTNGVNEFLGGNREGRVICFYGGNGTITSIEPVSTLPSEFKLYQNYPNPFNPSTEIKFDLSSRSFVTLKVFDALGKEVAELLNSETEAGSHKISFNAEGLSAGVYYYTLIAGNNRQTNKMMLIK